MRRETHGPKHVYSKRRLQLFFVLMMSFALASCAHHGNSSGHHEGNPPVGHRSLSAHADPGNSVSLSQFHHPEFSGSLEEELMLTDEQKSAFRRIETDYRKMVIQQTADIRAHEVDLARLLNEEPPDRQILEKQAQAIGDIKADLMMARMDSLLKLKILLTEGQYEQFRDILRDHMEMVAETTPHH